MSAVYFLNLFETHLTEMIVHGDHPDSGDRIIAYGKDIWVVDSNDAAVAVDIAHAIGLNDPDDVDTLEDVFEQAAERPGVLVGCIDGSSLRLWQDNRETLHPYTSKLIKKTVKTLGLKDVEWNQYDYTTRDDEDKMAFDFQLEGDYPEWGYHGTQLSRVPDILRLGIRPTENSNWDKVGKFDDLIFLAVDEGIASFHATTHNEQNDLTGAVLRFRIPDPSKFVPDYDVATGYQMDNEDVWQAGYQNSNAYWDQQTHQNYTAGEHDGNKWKEAGVFGYKGVIMPKFITEIKASFATPDMGDEEPVYYSFTPQEFMQAYQIFQEMGYYYPGIEDELDYEDEDY